MACPEPVEGIIYFRMGSPSLRQASVFAKASTDRQGRLHSGCTGCRNHRRKM